jgi:hypothetical protein
VAPLTNRDLELLRFVGEHRLVLQTHVQKLLGISAQASRARLRALARGGFLSCRRLFDGQPACCQIRRAGLAAVGSSLPAPRLDLARYAHDVGVAWLWLAARRGTFGPMREILAERTLRSHDRAADRGTEPYGVRVGGVGPRGHMRVHYPDLLLVTPRGRRIAVELELTSKGRSRRERILSGYAADSRIDAVLYLVEHRSTGHAIETSARRMGVSDRVHVQYFRWGCEAPPGERARATVRSHTAEVTR